MIEVINEDLLKITRGVICHQTNCMGVAGGLARAVFNKYPEAYSQYKITVQSFVDDWMPLGTTDLIEVKPNLYIANLYGQYDYGTDCRRTEYGTFRMCLRDLINSIQWQLGAKKDKEGLSNIYFPYAVGCGLGGGDWEIVKNIIKYEFSDYKFKIYICHKV